MHKGLIVIASAAGGAGLALLGAALANPATPVKALKAAVFKTTGIVIKKVQKITPLGIQKVKKRAAASEIAFFVSLQTVRTASGLVTLPGGTSFSPDPAFSAAREFIARPLRDPEQRRLIIAATPVMLLASFALLTPLGLAGIGGGIPIAGLAFEIAFAE